MTIQEHEPATRCSARAHYHTCENPFTFRWPDVPVCQFLAERDRAFDPTTSTGAIALDASGDLGTAYPATTPTLLHSHHNRGSLRMRSLVIQDEGLHFYTRTPGFSFD
jgi:hypothetical protein